MSKTIHFRIDDLGFSGYKIDSIISLLIWDADFLGRCAYSLPIKAFSNERYIIADLCYDYFKTYKDAPGEYIVDLVDSIGKVKKSQRTLALKYLGRVADLDVNKDYVLQSFAPYIQTELIVTGINDAKELVDKGNKDGAEKRIYQAFRDAKGVTGATVIDYLTQENMVLGNDVGERNFLTLVSPYDKRVGGIFRKEMILLFGDQNVGKTFACIHLTKVAHLQGKKTLVLVFETPKEVFWARYRAAVTGTNLQGSSARNGQVIRYYDGIKLKVKEFKESQFQKIKIFLRKRGAKFWLEQPMNFSFNDLVGLLNNIEVMDNMVPDVLIIDSPSQMELDRSYKDEIRHGEKKLYKNILQLTKQRNMSTIVTDWAGRQSVRKKLTRGDDIAEGYDKVRIPDTVWTFSQTEEEYKMRLLRWLHYKSRFSKKFLLMEIKQCLEIGQFCVDAKVYDENRAEEEAKRIERELGKKEN